MQLVVDNSADELLPGSYANARLQLPSNAEALSIPASALIFDAKGLSVATVGADNRVAVKPVTIARDLGSKIEIASGLGANDRVIQNPPDGIATGAEVRIAGSTAKAPDGAKPKKEKG
jgi:multidrug efflux pump subunit AcrA (membrane-fusion protein)